MTLNTEIPETDAASALPPTANRFLPKVVLFQMNQTMTTAATAHRMMVGKPPILGMIMLGSRSRCRRRRRPWWSR